MSELPVPEDLRELIHSYTGDLTQVRPAGRNETAVTAFVVGRKGRFLVKAVRNRRGGQRDSLAREAAINPYVRDFLSPPIVWRVDGEEWIALGFDVVEGRRADLSPNSTDLPEIVRVLDRVHQLGLPAVAWDWRETRWDACADDPGLLAGESLIYSDVHSGNFILGPHRTWLVDWSWPTRGASFITAGCWVTQLITSGHSPAEADKWAAQCEGWRVADPEAITAFAHADAGTWKRLATKHPDRAWLASMAEASAAWHAYRAAESASV